MTDFQIFKQAIVLTYSKIFQKHNGAEYTFSQVAFKLIVIWIPILILIKAKQLLLETGKTIKQIAKETGFRHSNNFTKAFSAYYGIAPNRYRKLHSSA